MDYFRCPDDFACVETGERLPAARFHIIGDYSTALWKEQTELILAKNGLASFIAHPDYGDAMTLVPDGQSCRVEGADSERARVAYATLGDDGRAVFTLDERSGGGR